MKYQMKQQKCSAIKIILKSIIDNSRQSQNVFLTLTKMIQQSGLFKKSHLTQKNQKY